MGYKITDEIIEKVREYNDIVDVIGHYIPLKKSGVNYKALCPFHTEKTPSFVVSPSKQIFHCFGCGVGGDVITFVMKYENVSFIEAVVLLAERANIKLEYTSGAAQGRKDERERLFKIMEWAKNFYMEKMSSAARDYLHKRGISDAVIKEFELGYAPNSWDALYRAAKQKQIKEADLELCGLIIKRDGKLYDRFRNKIIFPILDYMGRVIAFGSRVLDNSEPKYINSPETVLFNKSRSLYGIHIAKGHITREDKVIVVEGYMDVIKLHSAGFRNVVGVLGTALTPEHIKIINRYTRNLFLLFDSDSAGEEATNRAFVSIYAQPQPSIAYAVRLKGAKDPDEFIEKFGAQKLYGFINSAMDYARFKMQYIRSHFDLSRAEERTRAVMQFLEELTQFNIAESLKEEYIKEVAQDIGLSEFSLIEDYYRIKKQKKRYEGVEKSAKSDNIKISDQKVDKTGEQLLQIILNSDDINMLDRIFLEIDPEVFRDIEVQQVFNELKQKYDEDGLVGLRHIRESIYAAHPRLFIDTEDRLGTEEEEVYNVLSVLKRRALNRDLERIRERIKQAERSGDEQQLLELLKEYQELSRILKAEGGM